MAVHQVVPARGIGGLGAQHPQGELAELGGQVGLVQLLERARLHMPDEYPGHQFAHRGGVAGDRPGEDLHLYAAGGHALGDLDDVDVEAARVAGARLFQRRGMDADGRDPPWYPSRHRHPPPTGRP